MEVWGGQGRGQEGRSVRGVEASLKFPLFLRGLPSHCWCLPATRCLVTPPSKITGPGAPSEEVLLHR